jgi:hypothetical protein
VDPAAYSVERGTGLVTFTVAPAAGHLLTWGGLYDVEVRFADDAAFESVVRGRRVVGFSNINLEEVRPC